MRTRLNHARVNVKDMKKAVKWYEEILGFVCNDNLSDGTFYVDFEKEDGATFALLRCGDSPARGRYNFDVDNVDEMWLKLKDKVNIIAPIETMPYGTRKFTITDIDGNELGFVQQNFELNK